MFSGLLLASLSSITMRSALFQRKSRTGWLEELDGIREDALDAPEGTVTELVDGDDIWTDLREGGVYSDPHEISSLYATDETPDLPKPRQRTKPTAKPTGRAGRAARRSEKSGEAAAPEQVEPAAPVEDEIWTPAAEPARLDAVAPPPPSGIDADQLWVQPAPHPMRPTEMWHPAEAAPAQLGEEQPAHEAAPARAGTPAADGDRSPFEVELEARLIAAAERTVLAERGGPSTEAAIAEAAIAEIAEAESDEAPWAQDGPVIPPPTMAGAGLVRRNRRDRPTPTVEQAASMPEAIGDHVAEAPPVEVAAAEAPAAAEPMVEAPIQAVPVAEAAPVAVAEFAELAEPSPTGFDGAGPDLPPLAERGDTSPLPTRPLPPASLPTRPGRSVPAFEDGPAFDPAVLVVTPEEVAAPSMLVIDADGTIAVPGTIVRVGGARQAGAQAEGDQAVVVLGHGWVWVAPGDGAPSPVRVDLPVGRLRVEPGATALAVVEADGSAFAIVAAGAAEIAGPAGADRLERGTIVMIDAAGGIQADRASDDEIASDPIVAENLSLDAEL